MSNIFSIHHRCEILPGSSVNRLGKILPHWQHFKRLWQILSWRDYLVFGQILNLLGQFFDTIGQFFIVLNGQIL